MMNLVPLVDHYGSIPIMPRVMAHLLHELDRPAPDLGKVKRLMAADPGLTCRVLQVANATGNGMPGRVAGVAEAVDMLGGERLHALGLAIAAGPSIVALPGVSVRQYWRVSVNTAKLARSLAGRIGIDATTAFTAGMLHGVGEVIMQLGMPDEMDRLNRRVAPFKMGRARAEELTFGFSYAAVAAEFARKWRFPDAVKFALRDQLLPYAGDVYEPLVGVVHLAAWRARAHEAGYTAARYAADFPYAVALVLGLDVDDVLGQEPFDWGAPAGNGYLH